jgi:NAD(P)-dependent dehydrogenase (short-subunit alcohol dehydrogenase family)
LRWRNGFSPTAGDAIPLNRYGLETELAEAVFFLCSDRASYITGQILAVDGGFDAAGIRLPTLARRAKERVEPRSRFQSS